MKIKLGVLDNTIQNIVAISKERLPIKVAYSLIKFMKKADKELILYTNQKREIFKRYGAVETSGYFTLEPTHLQYKEAIDDLTTLSEIEIDIEFTKIKIKDLGDIKVTGEDLFKTSYLFEDEDG